MRAARHTVSVAIEKAPHPSPVGSNHLSDKAQVQLVPIRELAYRAGSIAHSKCLIARCNVLH